MGSGASTPAQEAADLFTLNLVLDDAGDKHHSHPHSRTHSYTGDTRYANGDVYSGKWRFDQKHGKGKYVYCEGSEEGVLYEGDWKHNVKHGKGKFYYRNGDGE
jgi:hypothetical protein